MINIIPKKQGGFSTLTTTVIVLLSATVISLFTTTAILTRQQSIANQFHSQQALYAAQAGLDYGIAYLTENKDAITHGQTLTGSLADGSHYSLIFAFKAGNSLIQIKSTGSSPDASASKTVQQDASWQSEGASVIPPTVAFQSRGSANLKGNALITNLENNHTIVLGGSINFSGNAKTVLSSGTGSNSHNIGSDITQGDSSLASKSDMQLQIDTVGQPLTNFASQADLAFNNSSSYNYNNQLNGQTGKIIYINQSGGTATINSNTVIGSPSNPVTIVVIGNADISGNTIIYGNVYATGKLKGSGNFKMYGLAFQVESGGDLDISGNVEIRGGVVTGGASSFDQLGNATITYDSSVLNSTLSNTITTGTYNKVPGSWTDLNP